MERVAQRKPTTGPTLYLQGYSGGGDALRQSTMIMLHNATASFAYLHFQQRS